MLSNPWERVTQSVWEEQDLGEAGEEGVVANGSERRVYAGAREDGQVCDGHVVQHALGVWHDGRWVSVPPQRPT
eukprot:765453-Hanusia_phi.AAC.2